MKMNHRWAILVLLVALVLAGCGSGGRVGELRTESQSVELGDDVPVRVEINLGAGSLELAGGAEKLLEAGFIYNIDALKPKVTYSNGRLTVQQPSSRGMPDWRGIAGFRNEWVLHLHDETPLDLNVDMGSGSGDLMLGGLALTDLDVSLGAGAYMVDLSGDRTADLQTAIEAGAADILLRLPKAIGARVVVESGPHTIDARGFAKKDNVYTNAAYGVSPVTLRVDLDVGVGRITLEEGRS